MVDKPCPLCKGRGEVAEEIRDFIRDIARDGFNRDKFIQGFMARSTRPRTRKPRASGDMLVMRDKTTLSRRKIGGARVIKRVRRLM